MDEPLGGRPHSALLPVERPTRSRTLSACPVRLEFVRPTATSPAARSVHSPNAIQLLASTDDHQYCASLRVGALLKAGKGRCPWYALSRSLGGRSRRTPGSPNSRRKPQGFM
jgi:hypothetical protein